MTKEELYMQRCLELATLGQGRVAPNPMVGCVIVHKNKIIGEGFHQEYGKAHAEVHAIQSVKEKEWLRDSTLYVNLEPCCHHGKTPPCTDIIIENNIPNVYVATTDPFAAVAGKGVRILQQNGINVNVGILKREAQKLNKRFFTFHEKKRPYIILKWAQTADGYIDIDRKPGSAAQPTWITSEKLRMLVHKWRTQEQGIMVGTITAFKDNPSLNVRDWSGTNPTRIVLDQNLSLSPKLNLFDNTQKTLVFNDNIDQIKDATHYIKIDFSSPNMLHDILEILHERNIQSLIVEGGSRLLAAFIEQNLWDEARIFQGSKFFSGGLKAPSISVMKFEQTIIGKEVLFTVYNPDNLYQ